MSISFPPDVEQFVEHEVAAGAYASRDELIVAAVELLRERQANLAKLKADIAEGLEGDGIPADEVFAQLRAKFDVVNGNAVP